MLNRRARLAVPGLALAGITVLTGAAGPGSGVSGQVRAAEQPQLRDIEAPAAWRLSQGRGVTVAVLDTGVDASAADLAGSVTTGPDYTLGADRPDISHRICTARSSPRSSPGTAAGRAGRRHHRRRPGGPGAVGPGHPGRPGARAGRVQLQLAVCQRHRQRHRVRHPARRQVINMSLGTGQPTRAMQAALGYAVSHGVLVVASAGNSGLPGAASRRTRIRPRSPG